MSPWLLVKIKIAHFLLHNFFLQTSRPTLAREVPSESSQPREGLGYILKAVYTMGDSLDAKFP